LRVRCSRICNDEGLSKGQPIPGLIPSFSSGRTRTGASA
jgi:hypothetical protein